ncbi:MAG: hypothetical protein Q9204_002694 [Flavoplaca sp. TL-2023a]
MQLTLFATFISLALAAGPIPFSVDDPQGDPNRLIPPIPPCVECTATCAAIFAACALFCAVPGDPFCEACVVTEDAALGDTCLTCLRGCFFEIDFPDPLTAPQPSPERTNVINNFVELTSKPPSDFGIAPGEGEVSTA